MKKFNLNDDVLSGVFEMSNGNPGALTALMEMVSKGAEVDPDCFMGGLGIVLFLDELEIYGSDIYVLHSDLCNRDLVKTISLIRAVQLGILDRSILKDACSRQDYSGRKLINVEEMYLKVCETLPNFKRAE